MLYNVLRLLLYPFLRLFLRVEYSGTENIPKRGGFLLCANHTSIADVLALAIPFWCHIRYMGKAELFRFPIARWFFQAIGGFSVERGKGDVGAIDKACQVVEKGGVLGIFPEGTRSKTGEIGRPKSGAALIAMRTKAPILPVSIRYSTGTYRAFCKITIRIGEVIPYTEPCEGESQRQAIRRVSHQMMEEIKKLWGQTS